MKNNLRFVTVAVKDDLRRIYRCYGDCNHEDVRIYTISISKETQERRSDAFLEGLLYMHVPNYGNKTGTFCSFFNQNLKCVFIYFTRGDAF